MSTEKYILAEKELHLGYIKETFHAGAVIEVVNGRIVIDGRKFDDVRDLDILKRRAAKFPDKPWIVRLRRRLPEKLQRRIFSGTNLMVIACANDQPSRRGSLG